MIRKDTIWLAGIALVVLVYTLVFEVDRSPAKPEIPPFLDAFETAQVNAIELDELGTNVLRVARTADGWQMEQPVEYPGQTDGPEALLVALKKIQPLSFVPEEKVESDYASYGLSPPRLVVRWESGNAGAPKELSIGDVTSQEGTLYARVTGQDGLFILPITFIRHVGNAVKRWRDARLAPLAAQRNEITGISIRSGPWQVVLQRSLTNRLWQVVQPAPAKRGDVTRIEQLLDNVLLWEAADFTSDNPKVDLEPYGLHSPVAELALLKGTNRLATVQFGNADTNQPDFVYARLLNHTNVVVVQKKWLDEIRAPVWNYCDHRLTSVITPSAVARVEVRAGDNMVLSQSTNGVWRITEPVTLPADPVLVEQRLLQNIMQLQADKLEAEVVGDFSKYGLTEPSASYTLRKRGGTNAIHTQITFGTGTEGGFFARRRDEGFVYVVGENARRALPSYAYELRERRLWSFLANEVAKITVVNGDRSTVLQRNSSGVWTRPGQQLTPADLRTLPLQLSLLGKMRAEAWTASGPDKLSVYGIIEKRQSITLELLREGKVVERKIQFGKRSPNGHYYAVATDPLDQGVVVFEFSGNIYQGLGAGLFPMVLPQPGTGGN